MKTADTRSELEITWDNIWAMLSKMKPLKAEYRFTTLRAFRIDRAHVASKVAVELEGATYGTGAECPTCGQRTAGRHTRGKGHEEDCVKYNMLASEGWRLFRFTKRMLDRETVQCVEMVAQAIRARSQ